MLFGGGTGQNTLLKTVALDQQEAAISSLRQDKSMKQGTGIQGLLASKKKVRWKKNKIMLIFFFAS